MAGVTQRRLAAEALGVGLSRVWMDPERLEDIQSAITKQEIRRLIGEGAIKKRPEKGVSRGRTRRLHVKRARGERRGPGTRKGGAKARASEQHSWTTLIRALRAELATLRRRRIITPDVYRKLYARCKGHAFDSVGELRRYIESQNLARRRMR
ncbi:MAG: 50S ribosomal protein L19e [Candidatus Bathyarchaeia archaeon]